MANWDSCLIFIQLWFLNQFAIHYSWNFVESFNESATNVTNSTNVRDAYQLVFGAEFEVCILGSYQKVSLLGIPITIFDHSIHNNLNVDDACSSTGLDSKIFNYNGANSI